MQPIPVAKLTAHSNSAVSWSECKTFKATELSLISLIVVVKRLDRNFKAELFHLEPRCSCGGRMFSPFCGEYKGYDEHKFHVGKEVSRLCSHEIFEDFFPFKAQVRNVTKGQVLNVSLAN